MLSAWLELVNMSIQSYSIQTFHIFSLNRATMSAGDRLHHKQRSQMWSKLTNIFCDKNPFIIHPTPPPQIPTITTDQTKTYENNMYLIYIYIPSVSCQVTDLPKNVAVVVLPRLCDAIAECVQGSAKAWLVSRFFVAPPPCSPHFFCWVPILRAAHSHFPMFFVGWQFVGFPHLRWRLFSNIPTSPALHQRSIEVDPVAPRCSLKLRL